MYVRLRRWRIATRSSRAGIFLAHSVAVLARGDSEKFARKIARGHFDRDPPPRRQAFGGGLVINLLRQNVSGTMLLQLGADLLCLLFAVVLAIRLHGHHDLPLEKLVAPGFAFALLIVCLNG